MEVGGTTPKTLPEMIRKDCKLGLEWQNSTSGDQHFIHDYAANWSIHSTPDMQQYSNSLKLVPSIPLTWLLSLITQCMY